MKSKKNTILALSCGPTEPVVLSGDGLRLMKELVRVGRYTPDGKRVVEITPRWLDHWEKTFLAFTKAGNKVPLPLTHDGAKDPDKNRGWVREVFRRGDSLFGIVELHGPDADRLAKTTDVSIYSPPQYRDGAGNEFKYPITHVALCTDPMVGNLDGFRVIAASLSSKENDVPTTFASIAKELGLADDADAAAIIAAIKKLKGGDKSKEVKAQLDAVSKERDDLKLSLAAATKREDPAPQLVKLSKRVVEQDIDKLVADNRVSKATADELKAALASDDAVKFSLVTGDERVEKIIAALAKNKVIENGERTGTQTIEMSRRESDSGGDEPDVVKAAKEMAAASKK